MAIETSVQEMSDNKKTEDISHIIYAFTFFIAFVCADLIYSYIINPRYDYAIFDVFSFSSIVIFAVLVATTFMNKWCRRATLLIFFAVTSFQWISFNYFGTYIRPIQIIQLLPDFTLITRSLFEVIAEMYSAIVLIFALGLVLILTDMKLGEKLQSNFRPLLFLLALVVWDAQYVYRHLNPNDGKVTHRVITRTLPADNRLAVDNFYRSASYLTYGMMPKIMLNKTMKAPALPEPEIATANPDVNVFFLVNETVRAKSLSILGHDKFDTTPRLAQIEDLYAAPIYSASTMTRTSFAGMMHRMKHPWIGEQFTSHSNCLFRLAKENGFKTHFLYSYDLNAAKTLFPFMCHTNIDNVKTRDDVTEELQKYDRNLFKEISELDFDKQNFVVIGMQGAHSPYKDNYPPEYSRTNNAYYNSIIYNDYTIEKIINIIKQKSKKPTIIISTSDHGELLEGEGKLRGHGWFHENVYTVPFLFLNVNGEKNFLAEDAEKVRSHFDVSTLILKALGYEVEVEDNQNKQIYINGTDLNGLAGRMEITIREGEVVSKTKIEGGQKKKVNPFLKLSKVRQ